MRKLLEKLDKEYFMLYLKEPLGAAPMLQTAESRLTDPKTLEITVSSKSDLNSIFAELDRLGIKTASLRNKTNRLEELFVHLTEDA